LLEIFFMFAFWKIPSLFILFFYKSFMRIWDSHGVLLLFNSMHSLGRNAMLLQRVNFCLLFWLGNQWSIWQRLAACSLFGAPFPLGLI
jgi:hypothetical protein